MYIISLQLGNIIYHKASFLIKCWIAYVTYWILYWKWKAEWSSGSRMVVKLFTLVMSCCQGAVLSCWLGAVAAATAQHHERGSEHMSESRWMAVTIVTPCQACSFPPVLLLTLPRTVLWVNLFFAVKDFVVNRHCLIIIRSRWFLCYISLRVMIKTFADIFLAHMGLAAHHWPWLRMHLLSPSIYPHTLG